MFCDLLSCSFALPRSLPRSLSVTLGAVRRPSGSWERFSGQNLPSVSTEPNITRAASQSRHSHSSHSLTLSLSPPRSQLSLAHRPCHALIPCVASAGAADLVRLSSKAFTSEAKVVSTTKLKSQSMEIFDLILLFLCPVIPKLHNMAKRIQQMS